MTFSTSRLGSCSSSKRHASSEDGNIPLFPGPQPPAHLRRRRAFWSPRRYGHPQVHQIRPLRGANPMMAPPRPALLPRKDPRQEQWLAIHPTIRHRATDRSRLDCRYDYPSGGWCVAETCTVKRTRNARMLTQQRPKKRGTICYPPQAYDPGRPGINRATYPSAHPTAPVLLCVGACYAARADSSEASSDSEHQRTVGSVGVLDVPGGRDGNRVGHF